MILVELRVSFRTRDAAVVFSNSTSTNRTPSLTLHSPILRHRSVLSDKGRVQSAPLQNESAIGSHLLKFPGEKFIWMCVTHKSVRYYRSIEHPSPRTNHQGRTDRQTYEWMDNALLIFTGKSNAYGRCSYYVVDGRWKLLICFFAVEPCFGSNTI